jgi:hypothetical protein
MNLTRLLADPPADYHPGQLQTEAAAVAVNIVGDQIAGYWLVGDEPSQAEWEAIVAAHVPQPDPPTAEERIAQLEADLAAALALLRGKG